MIENYLDDENYLNNLSDWSPEVGEYLANTLGINLNDAHWELIWLVREYYALFDHSPSMRPLCKFLKTKLGEEKGRSIYLQKLFPQSSAKSLACIAGLPKPDNCL